MTSWLIKLYSTLLFILCSLTYTVSLSAIPPSSNGLDGHFQLISGLTLAGQTSQESRRQLIWRQIDRSHLAPARADLAVSYTWGMQQQWQLIMGARLFRLGLNEDISRVTPVHDPRKRGLAAGDLCIKYMPRTSTNIRILLGQFRLNLEGIDWQHIGDNFSALNEHDLWLLEDSRWSESRSLIDRMVTGVSMLGSWPKLWLNDLDFLYRWSIVTPSAGQFGIFSSYRPGLLVDFSTELKSSTWNIRFHSIYGYQLTLPQSPLNLIDQELMVNTIKGDRQLVSEQSLSRNATWLKLAGAYRLTQVVRHQIYLFTSLENRWSTLKQGSLSQVESAVLSESNLLGQGYATAAGIKTKITDIANSHHSLRIPDHITFAYLWRDPHQAFAFDERHRLLFECSYQGTSSKLTVWWQHLWSSHANRWRLDQDLAGISLSFIQ